MAFDQSTRNRLHRFVSQSRAILMEEFTRQLQAAYGMDPANGTVADVDTLSFLDNEGQQTAVLLRETLAHYAAAIPGKSEKEKIRQGLDRIIREQSFTVLNRLAALRMAEARGFLIESISRGTSSKGFQLYKNLAGTALGETGDAYRCFLFSLFDEFSLDLAVLFDRHSVQGRLFPREAALLALLEQINHFEIEPLWAEDETIGWIYQYFNSQEERKQMRKASQAPRNSRELAVRNQFFTPRYVVEFLTDNTLGRIWYDMTQGHTALKDICRYLVRRPNEIFLAASETAPETAEEHPEALSREELLQQPVYVPFRKLKDPRELRMLDPACGSMHFGLYAFDLFETIYEEAWHIETDLGPDVFDRSTHLKPLQETYAGVDEFKKAIPQLIIEQNIHGVDIDPRAVQIAGLSLWQRAQRAWHQMGIKPGHRPSIRKSNIVCAEPMPGEKELLREFTAGLNPPVLGQLVETIFDKMQLAGEAGTLLKIEQEITSAISDAKDAYSTELLRQKEQEGFLPGMAPKREPTLFDFAELHHDSDFWETAEEKILAALKNYAAQAESHEGQKRLFAEDAVKGFAFIDLCRKRFDVVLMNPPFGSLSTPSAGYINKAYPFSKHEIYGCFIESAINRRNVFGMIGAITSRTWMFLSRREKLRLNVIDASSRVHCLIDLGHGVLDNAMVETCAFCLSSPKQDIQSTFIRLVDIDVNKKDSFLYQAIHNYSKSIRFEILQNRFRLLPGGPFAYWISNSLFHLLAHSKRFEEDWEIGPGLTTRDNERFLRSSLEIPLIEMCVNWFWFAKGGAFSPYCFNTELVLNYGNEGSELKAWIASHGETETRFIANQKFYFRAGFTYPRVTDKGFNVRILRPGHIFAEKGISIFPKKNTPLNIGTLAYLNSSLVQELLLIMAPSRSWEKTFVANLPAFYDNTSQLDNLGMKIINLLTRSLSTDPTSNFFSTIQIASSLLKAYEKFTLDQKESSFVVRHSVKKISLIVREKFGCSSELTDIFQRDAWDAAFVIKDLDDYITIIADYLLGIIFGRWDIRYATDERQFPDLPDPFDPLPVCPPGMLQNSDGLPAGPDDVPANYPLRISWPGILVIDDSSPEDISLRIREAIAVIWKENAELIEQETCDILGTKTLQDYFARPTAFFADHLKRYSKSRRQAPIYWPLQTPSGSYILWVYYHRLTDQTLYTCVNDFVEQKLKTVTEDLTALRNQSTRSSAEEKDLARLSDLEGELKDFRDELLRIAGFWKPDLNDGVQITAAPLWKLFQHRQWQNKLKDTWKKLEIGEYDWAHLACSIWPERVLRKCHSDRSLAIAHDVETDFWEEMEVPVIRRGKDTGKTKLEWQPKPLTESRLQELIHQKMAAMRSSH